MKVYKFIRDNKLLSAVLLIILSLLVTMIPVRSFIGDTVSYPNAILLEALLLQGVLLIISCFLLKVFGDNDFLGLKFENKVKDIYVIWPLILFFIMSAAGSMDFLESIQVDFKTIVLYVISFIVVSCFEEFMLRGVALRVFIDRYGESKKGIIKAVIISNLVFTLCCLNMYFLGQLDIVTTIFKMFNMFCLGVLYSAIFLRTKSIWVTVILHSLIELAGSVQALTMTSKESYDNLIASSSLTMEMAVPVIIMSMALLFIGLFFLKGLKE